MFRRRKRVYGQLDTFEFQMVTSSAKPALDPAKPAVLNSWKEIATYLGRGVRTVQRWHSDLALPVHRVRATPRSPVFAYKSELDLWIRQNAERDENDSPHVQHKHLEVSSAAERALNSAGKMSSLLGKQHDQLTRLADQVNRLAQLQKNNQRKVG